MVAAPFNRAMSTASDKSHAAMSAGYHRVMHSTSPALAPFLATLVALSLAACTSRPALPIPPAPPAPVAAAAHASVLLVSLDGFHPDHLDLGITPNLSRLAAGGVRAEWMIPSYPSLTFPNHYTIVTGLRPDRHGIVHNTMQDAELGSFSLSNRAAVGNGRWWGGEPIWVGAENAGLPTATLFWPGSEAPVQGVQPTRWQPYDETRALTDRVDTVLGWLGEPEATRPRFTTLYFEHLDEASHEHGPESPQARAVIAGLDVAMGRLLDGLAARGMEDSVNLIVLSDHGMTAVGPRQAVAVEDMADPADASVVTTGQSVGFVPVPGREARAEAQLLGPHERYECWRKAELPARWHYGSHPRIPPIVCQMHEGWDAVRREWLSRRTPGTVRGSHGFDPQLPSMRALFIADGPAFKDGLVVPAFDNVDVYPLLARLLGIEPAPNDGNAATLLPTLREPAPNNR